jgi:uncharacterized protein YaaN involved in tellurite resistance
MRTTVATDPSLDDAAMEAAIDRMIEELKEIHAQMARDNDRIARLKAESAQIKAETEAIKAETHAIRAKTRAIIAETQPLLDALASDT